MQISVIVPAYNESNVIVDTVEKIKKYLSSHFESFEIIVVNDGSSDETASLVAQIDQVILLNFNANQGKGAAVRAGVKRASGEYVLFIDADHSIDISELDQFWPLRTQADILLASRALPDSKVIVRQKFYKVFLGRLGNGLIRFILQTKVKDTQCGFKLFGSRALSLFELLTIKRWGFDFELVYLAEKKQFCIKEIPIAWSNNFDSKVRWFDYFVTLVQVFFVKINDLRGKYK